MKAVGKVLLSSLSPDVFFVGGEGWGEGVLCLRAKSTPSPRALSPKQGLGERGSDCRALRARQRYFVGAAE